MKKHLVLFLMLVGLLVVASAAEAVVIDFEALSDLDSVTSQFPGLTFTNATVLTAGISLNEFEFPPRSGANVVFDDGGPITIAFDDLQADVGGFVTYSVPLTLTAFNASGDVIGTDTSNFLSNLALSGDPGSSPNEFLGVAFTGGIRSITIVGDTLGSSYVLDDLTSTPVPEPSTVLLLSSALAGALGWRGARRFRTGNHK